MKKIEQVPAEPKHGEVTVPEHVSGASEAGWHVIQDALRCLKEHQFRHIRGIHMPQVATPSPLAKGSLFHVGRAHWFASGFKTDTKTEQKIISAVQEAAEASHLPMKAQDEVYALQLIDAYVSHWSMRPNPKVVGVEYKLGPAPMEPNDPFYFYRTARLDDVGEYPEAGGKLAIGECKTTSVSISDAINEYTLHGQPMLQRMLWDNCKEGKAKHGLISHVVIDVIKKPYGKDKAQFGRQALPVEEYSLRWFAASMRGFLRASAMMEWHTDVPRNVSACTRLIGRMRVPCEFRDLCMYGRAASGRFVNKEGKPLSTIKPVNGVNAWE